MTVEETANELPVNDEKTEIEAASGVRQKVSSWIKNVISKETGKKILLFMNRCHWSLFSEHGNQVQLMILQQQAISANKMYAKLVNAKQDEEEDLDNASNVDVDDVLETVKNAASDIWRPRTTSTLHLFHFFVGLCFALSTYLYYNVDQLEWQALWMMYLHGGLIVVIVECWTCAVIGYPKIPVQLYEEELSQLKKI